MSAAAHDPFLAEILAQPAALRRAGAAIGERAGSLAQLGASLAPIRAGGRAPVVLLTGMGGSLDACGAVLPRLAAGDVAAFAVETAELVNARSGLVALADLVVLVSQSGRSAEARRLAARLRAAAGPALCVVTNLAPNPLGLDAAVLLETRAGPEQAPSTGSFAASIVALDAVATALLGGSADEVAAGAVAGAEAAAREVEQQLDGHQGRAAGWRAWLGDRRDLYVLGRGVAASSARMGALLFKEATEIHAEAMSGAAFRHGPLEQAGPGVALLIVAQDERTDGFDADLARDLVAAGSPVAWIGTPGGAPAGVPAHDLRGPSGPLSAIPALVPLQLLAWSLARERGEPGVFRRAGKVTTKE